MSKRSASVDLIPQTKVTISHCHSRFLFSNFNSSPHILLQIITKSQTILALIKIHQNSINCIFLKMRKTQQRGNKFLKAYL